MIDIDSPGKGRITRNSSSTLNPIYTDVLPPSFVTASRITGRSASPPHLYTTAASPQQKQRPLPFCSFWADI
jgi:hypothetical protein